MNNGEKKDRRGGARPGAGRNRIITDLSVLTVDINRDTHDRLKNYTEKHGISYRVFIERALDRFEREERGGNPVPDPHRGFLDQK